MKKLFILFACVGMSVMMMAESVTINAVAGSYTKEQGDKYVDNAGTELKCQAGYSRDILSDFDLSTVTFKPDTALFNIYVTSVDIADEFALVVYGVNKYIAKDIKPIYSVAHAIPGILCDSVVTSKAACEGKFISFDVMPLISTLTDETAIGLRIEIRNLTEGQPLLKSQSYKGTSGQRPYLYLAKKEGGEPTSISDVRTSVKAVKQMVDGQLVIIRDGMMFNAIGQQIQ